MFLIGLQWRPTYLQIANSVVIPQKLEEVPAHHKTAANKSKKKKRNFTRRSSPASDLHTAYFSDEGSCLFESNEFIPVEAEQDTFNNSS